MIIKTKRLILRPFLETDAADVYEYLKEPAVNCVACMKLYSLDEAKAEMKKRLGETEYYFAITLKEGGKVIGEIDAYPEAGEPHAGEDAVRDTFSPCWMLNDAYQGKGYAFEAAQAFFGYLFSEKGARRMCRLLLLLHTIPSGVRNSQRDTALLRESYHLLLREIGVLLAVVQEEARAVVRRETVPLPAGALQECGSAAQTLDFLSTVRLDGPDLAVRHLRYPRQDVRHGGDFDRQFVLPCAQRFAQ